MSLSPRHLLAVLLAFAMWGLCLDATVTAQQKKNDQAITAAPQAPTLTTVTPNGAQRGTSVELTLAGTNLADPTGVLLNFPATVTMILDATNGKDAAKLRVKLDVPADTPVGFHTLRVATKNGISNARIFCVDDLPQIAEVDTNHTKTTAQPVPVPCVVMGRTDIEISDFFKIRVKPQQRLTFEVLGRRLGSALDPIILLHDAKTGYELPGLYSDDAPGLQTDARLTHRFKEAGEYLVEIRDTTHRGGPDHFYRLRIGDFPAAIAALPVAVKRGAKAQIHFAGPDVEGVAPVEIVAPTDPAKSVVNVAPKALNGLSGWPVPVRLSDSDEIAETEPNNEIAKANRLTVPGGVTGRFLDKGDVDYFVFAAKKGTKYAIVAETYEIGSPAEVYLVLKNAKNADLSKSTPTAPTARIDYTATDDGDLYIYAEHLNYAHGPNEVYHISVKIDQPDFDVNLGIDRFDVGPGGTTLIPISGVVRRNYNGPIELSIVGPPGFSGTTTIPAGVGGAAPKGKKGNQPPAGPAQTIVWLPLAAASDVLSGPYELHVLAKGKVNGKDVIAHANVSDVVKQSMANLPFPPREMLTSLGVGVTNKPLFMLSAKLAQPEVVRGTPANVTISATRAMGFTDPITLAAVDLPPNVTAVVKPIGKGANDIQVQLTAAAAVAPGTYKLNLRGTAKSGGKDFAYYATPLSFTVSLPFELKVEPKALALKPGDKAKVKVSVVRKGNFAGPIDVELKNLPANVTAPKTPIPMGKDDVEIEVTATDKAAAAEKADANASGTGSGNTLASPNFTVRVEKKADEKKGDEKKAEKKKGDEKKVEKK